MTVVNQPIAVLGAGSWGTALAILLARNGSAVRLWDHNSARVVELNRERENRCYLPGIPLPENLQVFADLQEMLVGIQDILICVPSHAFRTILTRLQVNGEKNIRLVWGTKGLDSAKEELFHQVVAAIMGAIPMAVLSGPSFAKEVALGMPTAVTLANNNTQFATDLVHRLHNQTFRVYTSDDLVGVQICGAIKNVIAVAVGASDGLGFGANARCALITRGLAEMARLCVALGGKQETVFGLAGVGDLILTATDNQSRNRRFGFALAQGKDLNQAQTEINQVVEGASNAEIIYKLAQKLKIEMPITEQVYRVLHHQVPVAAAVKTLLSRDPKSEIN